MHVVNRDFPLQHNGMREFAMSAEDSGCLARLITEVAPESISFMVYTRDYDMMPFVMGRSAAIKIGLLQGVNACEGGLVHVASSLQGCEFASGINSIEWISDQSIVLRMMTRASMHQNL